MITADAPEKKRLRGHAFRGGYSEVHEQVAQAVCEVEEGQGDQDQDVELHQRVAQDADPGVVVLVHHGREVQRTKNSLHQDVHRQNERDQASAVREQKPEEEVWQGGLVSCLGAHLANPIKTAAMTMEARAPRPNIVRTITLGGTVLSMTFKWMITPASLRNV